MDLEISAFFSCKTRKETEVEHGNHFRIHKKKKMYIGRLAELSCLDETKYVVHK